MPLHITLDVPYELNLVSKFLATLGVFLNLLLVHLVLFYSADLKAYRWFLLNYTVSSLPLSRRNTQVTSCVMDCYMNFLMGPVALFPYVAGYTIGPLWRVFGISSHAQMVRLHPLRSPNFSKMVMWYLVMCQTVAVDLTFYWRFRVRKSLKVVQIFSRLPYCPAPVISFRERETSMLLSCCTRLRLFHQ